MNSTTIETGAVEDWALSEINQNQPPLGTERVGQVHMSTGLQS